MSLLPLLLVALTTFAIDDERPSFQLEGRVTLPDGNPPSGVTLAISWSGKENLVPPRVPRESSLAANSEGAFEGRLRGFGDPFSVVAYDATRRYCGVMPGKNGTSIAGVTLALQPAKILTLRTTHGSTERIPAWLRVSFTRIGDRIPIVTVETVDGEVSVPLPAGEYRYTLLDRDLTSCSGNFVLATEGEGRDLGVIDLAPSYLVAHEGEVLPEWKVTETRGIALAQASLAAWRGKWLLVEFWGYW